ncbi:MAG TPA: 1-deoxy-D-xylulose-5-phosphate reductoisomerase [Candidatus Hydrogenedentes bacterium]|nr:1-deoxy-D-xylulose-5-phosphate reductoisomerase [Candidatus Hydrogenedentota bacterium]
MTRRRISILGSTGSIGRNALEVVRRNPGRFSVAVLASRSNVSLLREQIAEFQPELAAVYDDAAAAELRAATPGCEVVAGAAGLEEAAAKKVDTSLCAVVGAVGLKPMLTAINAGNRVAVANKEPLVMAGAHIMEQARGKNVEVLPVDSEHSAIFQCLRGNQSKDVERVHLTASGGPFYGRPPEELRHITPEQAMRHPTWDMGAKVSVDSATLMNKGLEIIEALCLFGLRSTQIEVVIHPQSVVHSMVAFCDGSIIAQLGVTDMKAPIAFALNWPERLPAPAMRLDVTSLSELTFDRPDEKSFPCLALAREAAEQGGCAPAVLNGANEEAVEAFCAGRIGFLDIAAVVENVLATCPIPREYTIDAVLEADHEARINAAATIKTLEQ